MRNQLKKHLEDIDKALFRDSDESAKAAKEDHANSMYAFVWGDPPKPPPYVEIHTANGVIIRDYYIDERPKEGVATRHWYDSLDKYNEAKKTMQNLDTQPPPETVKKEPVKLDRKDFLGNVMEVDNIIIACAGSSRESSHFTLGKVVRFTPQSVFYKSIDVTGKMSSVTSHVKFKKAVVIQ